MKQVPPYEIQKFHPKQTRYCVAVFVLNEGERILQQLDGMRPLAAHADIIIVDGGSTDGSMETQRLEAFGVNTLLTNRGTKGLSSQMRICFDFILREKYYGVITIDGNNKDNPSAIPQFIDLFDGGFDHIQGSRFVYGGQEIHTPPLRKLAIRYIHAPLMRMATGFHYTDTTNGFRGYSCRFLSDNRVAVFRDVFRRYELHYYLAIRAVELGFRVIETPVIRAYPKYGNPTKISAIRGNWNIFLTLLKAIFRYYHVS